MQRILLSAILLCILQHLHGQDCKDILILKKGNKPIQKFFTGTYIDFYTTDHMPVNGQITCIARDSIFLAQYQTVRVTGANGSIRFDTTARFNLAFSIHNIGKFPIGKQKGRNILTDGTVLMIGGAGYLLLNVINVTRQGDPPFGSENLPKVAGAAGAAAAGFGIRKLWPNYRVIGKKYRLQVLKS